MTDTTLPELGHYTHSKSGKPYQLLYRAKHSETLEWLCVYAALYDDGQTWVRPLNMWNELVEVNGEMVPRFKKTPTRWLWEDIDCEGLPKKKPKVKKAFKKKVAKKTAPKTKKKKD